uniref:Uncharacterized protein n=1 Tax=Pseudo-nitzschia australis TaxID=44445 RepID=A0A7S4AHF0_9STRA
MSTACLINVGASTDAAVVVAFSAISGFVFKATVAAVVCRATAVTSFHVREDGAIGFVFEKMVRLFLANRMLPSLSATFSVNVGEDSSCLVSKATDAAVVCRATAVPAVVCRATAVMCRLVSEKTVRLFLANRMPY